MNAFLCGLVVGAIYTIACYSWFQYKELKELDEEIKQNEEEKKKLEERLRFYKENGGH